MSVCRTRRIVPARSMARIRSMTVSSSTPERRAISPIGSRTKPSIRSSEMARILAFTGSVCVVGVSVTVDIWPRRYQIEGMGRRAFALLRTAFFASLFLLLWTRWVPLWFVGGHAYVDPRPAGYPIMAFGLLLALWCAFEFAWRGLGTPAPFD